MAFGTPHNTLSTDALDARSAPGTTPSVVVNPVVPAAVSSEEATSAVGTTKPRGIAWRQIILALIVVGVGWLVYSNQDEVRKLGVVMGRAEWQWLIGAALLQVGFYTLYATMYRWAFSAVNIMGTVRHMVPVLLGSLVVGIVAPAWSAAGTALFVDDAIRRGNPPERATTGTLLAHTIDFAGFSFVLATGLIILRLQGALPPLAVIASGVFLLFTLGMISMLLMGGWKPTALRHILRVFQSVVGNVMGWFHRANPLKPDWVERSVCEFEDTVRCVRQAPWRVAVALGAALSMHIVNLLSLKCIFMAHHVETHTKALIGGYSMGILATIISPTPQGIGVTEAAMPAAFKSFGIDSDTALAIALTFRGLTFWIPFCIGFLLLGKVRSFRRS